MTLLIYPHPSRLNLDYDFLFSGAIDPPTTLISLFIVAGLIAYSLWRAKKRPLLSFFILWYFGNLVVESSVFPSSWSMTSSLSAGHRSFRPIRYPCGEGLGENKGDRTQKAEGSRQKQEIEVGIQNQ